MGDAQGWASGDSISTGDLDGGGNDVLVGAVTAGCGNVFLYFAPFGGPATVFHPPAPVLPEEPVDDGRNFGWSVEIIGPWVFIGQRIREAFLGENRIDDVGRVLIYEHPTP